MGKWRTWAFILLSWSLFFIIDIVKKSKLEFESEFFLHYYLPGQLIWVVLTFPMLRLFDWSSRFAISKRIGILLTLAVVFGITKVTLNLVFHAVIDRVVHPVSGTFFPEEFYGREQFLLTEASIISGVVLVVLYLIESNRKYRTKVLETVKLESELTKAHLQSLKMQIHPHFLFNTLNAIVTLMRTKKHDQSLEMLLKLSDLLRVTLDHFEQQFIKLSEEITFITNYLEIEKVRFEDRLTVSYDLDPEAMKQLVPIFILQPIVENCIKHGVNKEIGNSTIEITTQKLDSEIQIGIKNHPGDCPDANFRESGVGLKNVRERLFNLYGEKAQLLIECPHQSVHVTLTIPFT